MTSFNFEINAENAVDTFEQIPAGTYKGLIIDAEVKEDIEKETKTVVIKLEITEGEHAGRFQMAYMNIESQNDFAMKIARIQLTKLCMICGIEGNLTNTDQFIDKTIEFQIALTPRKSGDGFYTNIKFIVEKEEEEAKKDW